jgi:hypothetical protein
LAADPAFQVAVRVAHKEHAAGVVEDDGRDADEPPAQCTDATLVIRSCAEQRLSVGGPDDRLGSSGRSE